MCVDFIHVNNTCSKYCYMITLNYIIFFLYANIDTIYDEFNYILYRIVIIYVQVFVRKFWSENKIKWQEHGPKYKVLISFCFKTYHGWLKLFKWKFQNEYELLKSSPKLSYHVYVQSLFDSHLTFGKKLK